MHLNHNLIENLSGIEQFKYLRVLELKFNQIKEINELTKIANPHNLTNLNLMGNPIEKDYRFSFETFSKTFIKYEFLFYIIKEFESLIFLNGKTREEFQPKQIKGAEVYETERIKSKNISQTEYSPFLTTFRNASSDTQVENMIADAKKKISSKLIKSKKKLPEITHCFGIPLQTTATFAQQKSINLNKRESHSFFFSNSNNNSNPIAFNEKKNNSQIFKNRFPIGKASFHEDISSFDISLINLETEQNNSQNLSFLAQSHLNKHIENINDDIEGLANIFHDKLLKEKSFKALKQHLNLEKLSYEVYLIIFFFTHKFRHLLEKKSSLSVFIHGKKNYWFSKFLIKRKIV